MPDQRDAVGGDAGVGFEGGDSLVYAAFEGWQRVFGSEATASAMGLDVEAFEFISGGTFCGNDLLEQIRAVGDDSDDPEGDERLHLFGVVGGPWNYFEAGCVEGLYIDAGVRAE